MTAEERQCVLEQRRRQGLPWHSPPHRDSVGRATWMLTASCYEHQPHIGRSADRMLIFEQSLLQECGSGAAQVVAWAVLPNHYHVLVVTDEIRLLLSGLGRLHGRTSYLWNSEDQTRGRKVWFGVAETVIKSDGHYWGSFNYIHANPVKHGYVNDALEWPFSSAADWSHRVGIGWMDGIQRSYPTDDYGKGWDD